MLIPFASIAGTVAAAMLIGAAILHLIPRLGSVGARLSDWLCRAPGLDLVVTYFTIAPLFIGPAIAGWAGLGAAVLGQIVGMVLWQWAHELAHLNATRGPRVLKVINGIFGRWRNHTAVWLTAIVTPLFWLTRVAQVAIYPLLTRLVELPPYRASDWVRVSRHKFRGLVGHDLIWCLYCDWMTGVWSLGSEMLRNVESFWCPIRFDHEKKCANCATDFPDVNHGWVRADGTMAEVAELVETMYGGGQRGWFGHPVRLTVRGEPLPGGGNGSPAPAPASAGTTADR